MDKKYYNILWIDDEHAGMAGFKGDAKYNSIKLISFKSLNGGISELKKNYPFYDGVILDAKFFENEDDSKGSEDTVNVHRAKDQLLLLPKKFEVFVLTGQAEAYEDKTFNKAFNKVYEKGNDNDVEQLFVDIKSAADLHEGTQIRHEYNRVFDVCTERYIGETAAHDLVELLAYQGNGASKLNQIRKIIEDVFQSFCKYDLLPKAFFNPNPATSEISKFLSGENTIDAFKNYKLREESILPSQISNYLKTIILATHSGSHRGNADAHIINLKTPYLFKSILFQLLDVLIWFKQYVDQKPTTKNWEILSNINQSIEEEDWIEGEVINYNSLKGYAFLCPSNDGENQFITPNLVSDYELSDGQKVKGTIEEYTDHRSGELKTRINNIEKL